MRPHVTASATSQRPMSRPCAAAEIAGWHRERHPQQSHTRSHPRHLSTSFASLLPRHVGQLPTCRCPPCHRHRQPQRRRRRGAAPWRKARRRPSVGHNRLCIGRERRGLVDIRHIRHRAVRAVVAQRARVRPRRCDSDAMDAPGPYVKPLAIVGTRDGV